MAMRPFFKESRMECTGATTLHREIRQRRDQSRDRLMER